MRPVPRLTLGSIAILGLCLTAMPQEQPGERYSRSPESAASDPMAPEARIDINLATEGELLKVPGMTPTWARRILRFRPYRSKQDLLDSGVVSGEVYDRIRNYVIAHRDSK